MRGRGDAPIRFPAAPGLWWSRKAYYMARQTASPTTLAPRLIRREAAAAYCGLSVQGFGRWVRLGRLPGPIPGTARWDLKAIDIALELRERHLGHCPITTGRMDGETYACCSRGFIRSDIASPPARSRPTMTHGAAAQGSTSSPGRPNLCVSIPSARDYDGADR